MLITLDGRDPVVQLRLVDGAFSEIALPQNLGVTSLELATGTYVAYFQTSASRVRETFLVFPNDTEHRTVHPPERARAIVDAASPLSHTNGFDAGDADVVADLSRKSPAIIAGKPSVGSLLVTVRRRPRSADRSSCERAAFSESPWRHVSVLTAAGEDIGLSANARTELETGWACAHLALPAGAYQLRVATRAITWSQFVYVIPSVQTQLFVLDRSAAKSGDLSAVKVSVHFSDGGGFDPAAPGARATEEYLNLVAADASPRMTDTHRHSLFELPSLALHLAVWLAEIDQLAFEVPSDLSSLNGLRVALPNLPDVELLSKRVRLGDANDAGSGAAYELSLPPMLARSWDVALWMENAGTLKVPSASPAARLGPYRLGSGAWLRFKDRPATNLRDDEFPVDDGLDLSGKGCDEFLSKLHAWVDDELNLAGRVQYNSTNFSVFERRLLAMLCPAIDTTLSRIAEQAGDVVEPATAASEDALVEALGLPRASIAMIAEAALTKLLKSSALPTAQDLNAFVDAEVASNVLLKGPLDSLKRETAGIQHVVEERDLTLLILLYLTYRGSPAQSHPMTEKEIAGLLSSLGFVTADQQPVHAEQVAAGLAAAAKRISTLGAADAETGELWDEPRIRLTPPPEYVPGQLCRITRSPRGNDVPDLVARLWNDEQSSYSMSLWRWEDLRRADAEGSQSIEAMPFAGQALKSRAEYSQKITYRTGLPALESR